MAMLVDCSNCRTPLQLPPGATSIRCALCQAVTQVAAADPRGFPPSPSPHPHSSPSHHHQPHPPPSPYDRAPVGQPPSVHGRKRAVIVGISYKNSRHELKGCVNDARCMKYLLINRFKFPESSIITLTEEEPDPLKRPTKQNIRMAMYWLVQGCRPGDSLVFHYSGHGSQQRNYNGDEVDGFDETLCPLDFETQGMIVDDEINATMVRPLPHGVKLHAIIDACHSGTVLDLPFLCRMDRSWICGRIHVEEKKLKDAVERVNGYLFGSWICGQIHLEEKQLKDAVETRESKWMCLNIFPVPFLALHKFKLLAELYKTGRYVWEDHRPPSGVWKGTSGGEVVSFSGCDDDQTSADTAALSRVTSTGAMTFSFIQAVERDQATTYGNMLTAMRSTIRNTDNGLGGGVVTSLLTMLMSGGSLGSGFRQEPQLTSNERFDVYTKPFSL